MSFHDCVIENCYPSRQVHPTSTFQLLPSENNPHLCSFGNRFIVIIVNKHVSFIFARGLARSVRIMLFPLQLVNYIKNLKLIISGYLNSPVHGLYKMDYIKFFVGPVSRHCPTSAINATQLYTPTHVKL